MKKQFFLLAIIVVIVTGCGRDLSNVKTSLYGHWVDEASGIHYYISDGNYIRVDDEGAEDKLSYKVVEHDTVKNTIVIQENVENGAGDLKEFTFENDDREAVEVVTDTSSNGNISDYVKEVVKDITQEETVENWEYVDDKQKP
ncbi:hypothetical protein GH741_01700 [Aquibacillus halophilus]|uniref:Lipoprotein n=1 Tax=Aquibacillus halophilus TaxID=930132 RepID=A0A6A8D6J5_9BACI|nr:hypothetical protein [Aquibacillus halophilus]MRH41385.1 hypothetical protein [Aquibacillus halophilus]